jgi:transcription elongation factor Elf1
MDELSPTLWVCPACKLLQFDEEDRKVHTRYPHPVQVTGEEADDEPEYRPDLPEVAKAVVDRTGTGLSVTCPHCQARNEFPGCVATVDIFICSECGQPVQVEEPLL